MVAMAAGYRGEPRRTKHDTMGVTGLALTISSPESTDSETSVRSGVSSSPFLK